MGGKKDMPDRAKTLIGHRVSKKEIDVCFNSMWWVCSQYISGGWKTNDVFHKVCRFDNNWF